MFFKYLTEFSAILNIYCSSNNFKVQKHFMSYNTHTHNRFTAGLEYVRVHPGQQVPER